MQPATSVNEAINIIKIMQKVCARLATEVVTELARFLARNALLEKTWTSLCNL